MEISKRDWKRYIKRLSAIDKKAAETMQFWMDENPDADVEELIWVATNVAGRYGEAAGALACEMYDSVAAAQGVAVPPAEIAEVPDYGETAKAVLGTMKNKQNTVPSTVGRLVKRVGADTMLKNAQRDGAQFAWVPMGDTCSFCLTLASRGWQYMSKAAMKHGHAEHIHANCDCTYAIRFDESSTVEGYDPDRYLEMYENAEGNTPAEKINSMRRAKYAQDKDRINAQKRVAYARRKANSENVALPASISNDIIATKKIVNTKITETGKVINPMNEEDYLRIKEALASQGIEVFAATEGDDLRYMLMIGAEGTYSDGRITHIGKIPSRGTLFEEMIHMAQAKKYGELSSNDLVELCAREIEANRQLLKQKKAYRLDELDITDIENNLESWEKLFLKQTGVKYDDSNYRG